jgi:Ca-activated chloride channel homolog
MSTILSIACSIDKEALFTSIQDEFNAARHQTSDGEAFEVRFHFYEDADVIHWVLARDFQLFLPSSGFSLFDLQQRWGERRQGEEEAPVEYSPFAASPVVFAMSQETHETLGGEATSIGWHTLLEHEPPLRLTHAHGGTVDGVAVLAAEWVWAAGGRDPSPEDTEGRTRDMVGAIEGKVVEYGPDDRTVLSRWRSVGADVVVAQERLALAALADSESESVIVYPDEGTVWVEQVVARVRAAEDQRAEDAYRLLSAHLRSSRIAARLRSEGLHPTGAVLGSPDESAQVLTAHPAGKRGSVHLVNPGAPPMVLPGYRSVRIISTAWEGVAKAAHVCLVLDCSGSMGGVKLRGASDAVRKFCSRSQSTDTTLSLVTFDNSVSVRVPAKPITQARPAIEAALNAASAKGGTALFDAVLVASRELEGKADPGHLRAMVLLTDGEENSSASTLHDAKAAAAGAGLVYAIAYGDDADVETLRSLAGATGLALTASVGDIERIYEALSAHV